VKAREARRVRGFEIVVLPEKPDRFGVRLIEADGVVGGPPIVIAVLTPDRTEGMLPVLLDAVRASRHSPAVLSPDRVKPIRVNEDAGVRLALALLATAPVRKPRRLDAMIAAVKALTTEEAYYWYALCMGRDGDRMQRAFRLFLAED
jgi:hypothetical protein